MRRIAKGETRPSKVTGTAKRRRVPRRELKKMLTETCDKPVIDHVRMFWPINGRIEMESAATAVIVHSTCTEGERSARRPPIKYPAVRETKINPITLAQIKRDV